MTNKVNRLETLLYALGRVPGLGFLTSYAQEIGAVNSKISRQSAQVADVQGSLQDAKAAVRDSRR